MYEDERYVVLDEHLAHHVVWAPEYVTYTEVSAWHEDHSSRHSSAVARTLKTPKKRLFNRVRGLHPLSTPLFTFDEVCSSTRLSFLFNRKSPPRHRSQDVGNSFSFNVEFCLCWLLVGCSINVAATSLDQDKTRWSTAGQGDPVLEHSLPKTPRCEIPLCAWWLGTWSNPHEECSRLNISYQEKVCQRWLQKQLVACLLIDEMYLTPLLRRNMEC